MEQDITGFGDKNILTELANVKMPFGKYKGLAICDLPEPYLVWFKEKGFPSGHIGVLLASMYEIKLNGLEYLVKPLKQKNNQGF